MRDFRDEDKRWIREFWSAKESYDFSKTRSVLAYREAELRMQRAVAAWVDADSRPNRR